MCKDKARIDGVWLENAESISPMDDPTPIAISAGALYTLICGGALACGSFDGSDDARVAVIMALTVTIPEAKRILREAGSEQA